MMFDKTQKVKVAAAIEVLERRMRWRTDEITVLQDQMSALMNHLGLEFAAPAEQPEYIVRPKQPQ